MKLNSEKKEENVKPCKTRGAAKEIVMLPVSEVRQYEKNPRKNNDAVQYVKASIKKFGFKQPIIIDRNRVIVCGHTRLLAAKSLGMEEVPCIFADDLTDEQVKAYRLADNKVAEFAEWDTELLNIELGDLDIDMTQFGFEPLEEVPEEPEAVEPEEVEIPDEVEERAKTGDLWKLGEHLLLCGDSTRAQHIERLMGGAKADLVFTDPPYGMKKESEGVLNDNLNYDDLLDFNCEWIPLSFEHLKDTGCWYCWGIDEPLMDIYANILKPMKKANRLVIRNFITWAKHSAIGVNSTGMLSYPRETEKCWFVMKGQNWTNNNVEFFNTKYQRILDYMQGEALVANIGPQDIKRVCGCQMYSRWFTRSQFAIISEKHYKELQQEYKGRFLKPYEQLREMLDDSNDPTACLKPYFDNVAKDGFGDIGLTDVWRIPTTSNKERENTGGHATPKPIALCCRAITASSRENETALDMFGGSGSTLVACEQIKRKCRMIELDPHYCDVIIARWEKFTGQKAVKV